MGRRQGWSRKRRETMMEEEARIEDGEKGDNDGGRRQGWRRKRRETTMEEEARME